MDIFVSCNRVDTRWQ